MSTVMIGAAMTTFNAARDMMKLAFEAKIDSERQDARIKAMALLGEAQDDLFKLRDELLRLQDEIRDLKSAANTKASLAESYEMFVSEGGAVVYRHKREPEHLACPTCMAEDKVGILQPSASSWGVHMKCPACKNTFQVKPAAAKRPPTVPIATKDGWMGR